MGVIGLMAAVLLLSAVSVAWAQGPPVVTGKPAVLAFDRKACPVCHRMEMTLREVQERYPGQFEVRRLYIDEAEPEFRRQHVVIVPTQIFLDSAGKEVFRHEGLFPREELLKKLKDLKFIRD
jgi:thioredoxin 1